MLFVNSASERGVISDRAIEEIKGGNVRFRVMKEKPRSISWLCVLAEELNPFGVSRKSVLFEGAMSAPIVGIRREGKSRWERRSPLAPVHVKALVEKGIKVLVQPSPIRVYHDSKYVEVRSIRRENEASISGYILGIKEYAVER